MLQVQQDRPLNLDMPHALALPPDPPFFLRSPISSTQAKLLSSFETSFLDQESTLGPFKAGSVNVNSLKTLFASSPFPEEQSIIVNSIRVAEGHKPPWSESPPPRASEFALRFPEMFSDEEVRELDADISEGLLNGTYSEVPPEQVAVCLARRPIKQGAKFRIIDNARPVNAFMNEAACSVAYEDLRWAKAVAGPFMSKIDLRKGYRQLRLSPETKPFFCFFWRNKFYQFNVIAFGDASAPQAFTKFMRGFAIRWRKLGIVCLVYLDDILIAAKTFDRWLWSMKTILGDLFQTGVRIGVDKLFLGPFDCLEFLGVFINFRSTSFFISEPRIARMVGTCSELMEIDPVPVKQVQALLGLLSFFNSAYQGLSLFRRSLDLWVAKHADIDDASLSPEARSELEFWMVELPSWKERQFQFLPFLNKMMITDASETAWGGVVVQGPQVIFAAWGQLPPELLGTASLTRELFGLLEFWKLALHVLPQGHARLQVQMDNQGATCLINKTKATTATTLPIMREIHQLQEEHDIHLVVDWRERTDSLVSLVDRLSKLIPPGSDIGTTVTTAKLLSQGPPRLPDKESAEWALHPKLFRELCLWAWGPQALPDIDLFATAENAQVPSFCSRYFSPDSEGNAFSVAWSSHRLYAFPPFSQISECVSKIKESKNFSLLFVTKFDRSAPFWPLLLSLNPIKKKEVRRDQVILCLKGKPQPHPPFDLAVFLFRVV